MGQRVKTVIDSQSYLPYPKTEVNRRINIVLVVGNLHQFM